MTTKNQNRINIFQAIALPILLFVALAWLPSARAAFEFSKLVPITGGTPAPRLSVALGSAGYTGSSAMDEMTLCVPPANVNTMYVGSSASVNATTGFPLEPGSCITYRSAARAVEASATYLFVSSTESVAVTLRQR